MKRLKVGDKIGEHDMKRLLSFDGNRVIGKGISVIETDVGNTIAADSDWAYYQLEDNDLIDRQKKLREITDIVTRRDRSGLSIEEVTKKEPETVCAEADRLVDTDRDDDYGHPTQDFTRIGKLWGVVLDCDPVPAKTVGLMLLTLKVAREIHKPKRDTRVDGCGYWKCLDMIEEEGSETP